MSVELLQTMQWTNLCWERSFHKVLKIHDILPQVGQIYPASFIKNEDIKEGYARLLWCPPHSELNGWHDKRPSEILKSYVIEGKLKNKRKDELCFDFEVDRVVLLTEYFGQVAESYFSPLSYIGLSNGQSEIQWKNAAQVRKIKVGNYWYLSGSECETTLELIFSFESKGICIHYSAVLCVPSLYQTTVTKYYLTYPEAVVIKNTLNTASEIIEIPTEGLGVDEVLGAEYY